MNKIILAIAAVSPILAASAADAGTPLVNARQNARPTLSTGARSRAS